MQIETVSVLSTLVFKLRGLDDFVRVIALPRDQSRLEKHRVLRDDHGACIGFADELHPAVQETSEGQDETGNQQQETTTG